MGTRIRPELPGDVDAIREVNLAAFPSSNEADLVDALRPELKPWRSYVADRDGRVVGHLLFTPVRVDPPVRKIGLVGLGPMSVHPEFQGQGVGSTLVDAGLAEVGRDGVDAVVVLGHPEWYPRFGFQPAAHFGLTLALDAPADAFMAVELVTGALMECAGEVHYHQRFSGIEQ